LNKLKTTNFNLFNYSYKNNDILPIDTKVLQKNGEKVKSEIVPQPLDIFSKVQRSAKQKSFELLDFLQNKGIHILHNHKIGHRSLPTIIGKKDYFMNDFLANITKKRARLTPDEVKVYKHLIKQYSIPKKYINNGQLDNISSSSSSDSDSDLSIFNNSGSGFGKYAITKKKDRKSTKNCRKSKKSTKKIEKKIKWLDFK
jgi:hypothetical protein